MKRNVKVEGKADKGGDLYEREEKKADAQ